MPSRQMLGQIGYMPQAEAIYPELSVGENLAFFARLEGHADKAAIDRVLDLVELRDRKGTPALQLSGGMRRRLSLACTLVHEPTVLFLDEPTVGVDPALRVQFWSHFRRLAAAGTTILVASHVMDEADRCDELLFVRRRQGHRPRHRRRDAGACRHAGPRGRVPVLRPASTPTAGRSTQPTTRRTARRERRREARAASSRSRAESRRASGATSGRSGLMFVAPLVIIALLGWVMRDQTDTVVDVVVVNQAGRIGRQGRDGAPDRRRRPGERARGRRGRRHGGRRRGPDPRRLGRPRHRDP